MLSALGAATSGGVLPDGSNPHPVQLVREPAAPLSAMAQIGRRVFFDRTLSASGQLSCASCHSPGHAFGPPGDQPVMEGGASGTQQGVRAVPSLMYLERQPNFSIGPDDAENEGAAVAVPRSAAHAPKSARAPDRSAQNLVPQGGLFWDGRADTLQAQAIEPLLNPREMAAGGIARVAARLRRAPYARQLVQLFGPSVFDTPRITVAQALFAVARYQFEDPAFHPYTSKFDRWLAGRARFTPAEARGYAAFNDPARGNCAACHLDQPTAAGLPPLFTDHQYEALGVPRNTRLQINRNPAYDDLGICGPLRTDLARSTQYCGMFLTPTLRNVATRHAFFHNGQYRSLADVLTFYADRDTAPQRIYPRRNDGSIAVFDDLPAKFRANIDTTDGPFGRARGQSPPLTAQEQRDIIAFLHTLTDQGER